MVFTFLSIEQVEVSLDFGASDPSKRASKVHSCELASLCSQL